ncbi:MAG: hypothetical protein Q4E06_10355 [Lautropia sp.]|nr:hypothetical protein [Lautropia sp.]
MLPLLPFIAGIAAGAAGAELWRRGEMPRRLGQAGRKLRSAATSGLDSVRQSGAALRDTVAEKLQRHDVDETPVLRTSRARSHAQAARRARRQAASPRNLRALGGRHRKAVVVPAGLARRRSPR